MPTQPFARSGSTGPAPMEPSGTDQTGDYLAFADDETLAELGLDTKFHVDGIDLMIVTDGIHFAKPWVDSDGQKCGTLAEDVADSGFAWSRLSPTTASYIQSKPDLSDPKMFNSIRKERRAVRVYPSVK
jgi:hypothetical protein